MNIRTIRHVTQRDYLRQLEAEHGSLREFDRRTAKKSSKRALVEEWKWLAAHPERGDEIVTLEEEMIFHDAEKFLELITPQRLRLLEYLRSHPETDSLNQLAQNLERNYRNVHEDVQKLASVGLIRLDERPNRVVPRVLADAISVTV
jgi:predicted transcriptional regulator